MCPLEIHTNAFEDHGAIPRHHAKDGNDLSPALQWSGIPKGTVEMALTCVDPDAPNGTFVHWLATWSDSALNGTDEGKPPIASVEGKNGYGDIGYGGPRPPEGDPPHRYFFRVHAFSRPLQLSEGFTYEELQQAAEGCEIASAQIVGTYQR
jgi:Raf kinase inhibitor-like YbhB/YbcL family protein